jgi:hypothetical protein
MVGTETRAEGAIDSVELAAADAVSGVELALIGFMALLFSPPLLIPLVIVAVPTIALGLIASVFAVPVIVARHLHARRLASRP